MARATYECGTTSTSCAGVSVATDEVNKHNKYGITYGITSRGDVTFSRNHETEADQIGLTLMAIAG
jgi:predicted Zn-dependent protease